jgi:hypothetical protein
MFVVFHAFLPHLCPCRQRDEQPLRTPDSRRRNRTNQVLSQSARQEMTPYSQTSRNQTGLKEIAREVTENLKSVEYMTYNMAA